MTRRVDGAADGAEPGPPVDVADGVGQDVLLAVLEALDSDTQGAAAALRPVRSGRHGEGDLDVPDAVVDFEVVAATRTVATLLGLDQVVGCRLSSALPPPVAADAVEVSRRVLRTGEAVRQDVSVRVCAGDVAVEHHGEAVRVLSRGYVVVLWHDHTELQRARRELEDSERRMRALVEHSQDGVLVLAPDSTVTYASPAARRLLGGDAEPGRRPAWDDAVRAPDREATRALVAQALAAGPGETVAGLQRAVDGLGGARRLELRATNHLSSPGIGGLVVNVRDVTDAWEAERALQQQSMQDALTGLPNRRWFLEALRHAVGRAERGGGSLAVLLVDLDDFKVVNDSLGHAAGDRLIVQVAERIVESVRPADSVARLGGDEFVVIAEGLAHEADAVLVAERISAAASGLYDLGNGLRSRVSLSVGVCTASGIGEIDLVLAHADAALYKAKQRGRNRVEVFDPGLREQVLERLHLEHDLHDALERDELLLHWQPIVALHSERGWRGRTGARSVVAAEALIRWQHPERGLLAPGLFLPVAEQCGLMPQICDWVADRALAQAARWGELPVPPRVFVNLSAVEVSGSELADRWSAAAARRGVDPTRVTTEVSERVLPADVLSVGKALRDLRDRGFGIALDDFGAGNTALSWLQQLPLDLLKLDRRFVAALDDPATQAIVRSLVGLAPLLGLQTIAEGVETEEQLLALEALGCPLAQGYHLARPGPAGQVTALLE